MNWSTLQLGSATRMRIRAFTLVELLTVIAIMAVVAAITIPMLGAIIQSTQSTTGINTVHVAVTAARAYAIRDRNGPFAQVNGQYSGTAIIFTPANEMRLVENVPFARYSGGYLEAQPESYNGYEDIPGRDYLRLPSNLGVVGLARNDQQEPLLLTPPFAIRFNEDGHLIAARDSSEDRSVFYDRNYDGVIAITRDRDAVASYTPDAWDPNSPAHPNVDTDPTLGRYHLPFDRLDAVIGAVLYSKKDFRAATNTSGQPFTLAGSGSGNPLNSEAAGWILENGTPMFFSRYSGAAVRDR